MRMDGWLPCYVALAGWSSSAGSQSCQHGRDSQETISIGSDCGLCVLNDWMNYCRSLTGPCQNSPGWKYSNIIIEPPSLDTIWLRDGCCEFGRSCRRSSIGSKTAAAGRTTRSLPQARNMESISFLLRRMLE